jgi:RNA polymerase primary sigma factor
MLTNPTETEAPDRWLCQESLKKEIARSLSTLSEREQEVIKLYYGLWISHPYTLEEVGEKMDLTRERIRQIKEKAIRKLKFTNRSKLLRQYLGQ